MPPDLSRTPSTVAGLRLSPSALVLVAANFVPLAGVLFLGWSVFSNVLTGIFPVWLVDLLSNFSFITHFDAFTKGIIDPKDVVFFLSLMGFTLFLNVVTLER